MKRVVKQLRNGQITIPKDVRDQLGIEPDDLLSIDVVDGKIEVEPVRIAPRAVGSEWAREMYRLFAPVRRSLKRRSEQEINEAIDDAVGAVRRRKK